LRGTQHVMTETPTIPPPPRSDVSDGNGEAPPQPPVLSRVIFFVGTTVLLFVILIPIIRHPRSIEDRIRGARRVSPGVVYQVENMTATLVDVADLGDKVGIHLVIGQPEGSIQRSTGRDDFKLDVQAEDCCIVYPADDGAGEEAWLEFVVPTDGRVRVDVHRWCTPLTPEGEPTSGFCRMLPPLADPIGSFVIDFDALRIPTEYWR
jgi:hypothetical protein